LFTLTDNIFFLYLFAFCVILLTAVLVRFCIHKKMIHGETGRKILHLISIMTSVFVVHQTPDRIGLALIFFTFSIVLFVIAHKNILLPSPRRSYGIALFPVAFGILLLLPLSQQSVLFAMSTLGISDAAAGMVGEHFARKKHFFLYEQKSWLGFFTFYVSTFLIGYLFIGWTPVLFVLALVPALSELFSYKGSDNFTVPLMAAVWFTILKENPVLGFNGLFFVAMMLIFAIVYYKKWLSMPGSAAAVLLGTVVIFSVGPLYLVPIALFFITGSLTSKLHPKSGDASGRNAFQVFANGLVAVLLLVVFFLTEQHLFLLASLVSVAISLADTLSSDIGIYFKHKTYDITTFRPVKVGLSGGVSLAGTLFGTAGSFVFAVLVGLIFHLEQKEMMWIGLAGTAGMVIDSILGSLFQAKYIKNDDISEEKTANSTLIRGFSWLNNDGVNLLANVLIVGFFVWITQITGI
jgi:uncharacterized protein (TIGR00297 family)